MDDDFPCCRKDAVIRRQQEALGKEARRRDLREVLGFEIQVASDGSHALIVEDGRNRRSATPQERAMWDLLMTPEKDWGA